MAEKEKIYLTDIALHTRDFRQTTNFSNAAVKGRMYSPLPKESAPRTNSDKSSISIQLPPDLIEKIKSGEIKLVIPKDGLSIYAGKDVYDKLNQLKNKTRNQLIHNNRDNIWHA
jgi:hypothetical protein